MRDITEPASGSAAKPSAESAPALPERLTVKQANAVLAEAYASANKAVDALIANGSITVSKEHAKIAAKYKIEFFGGLIKFFTVPTVADWERLSKTSGYQKEFAEDPGLCMRKFVEEKMAKLPGRICQYIDEGAPKHMRIIASGRRDEVMASLQEATQYRGNLGNPAAMVPIERYSYLSSLEDKVIAFTAATGASLHVPDSERFKVTDNEEIRFAVVREGQKLQGGGMYEFHVLGPSLRMPSIPMASSRSFSDNHLMARYPTNDEIDAIAGAINAGNAKFGNLEKTRSLHYLEQMRDVGALPDPSTPAIRGRIRDKLAHQFRR